MDINFEYYNDPEMCIELGNKYFFESNDPDERKIGLKLLNKAVDLVDAQAMYIIGKATLQGLLHPITDDSEEHGIKLLRLAYSKGVPQARSLLNHYCRKAQGNALTG